MHSGSRVLILALSAVTLLSTQPVSGQSITPCVRTIRMHYQREIFIGARQRPRPAFTATIKQSFEQTLVDGSTVQWTTEEIHARDESGRVLRQSIDGCDLDSTGQPQLRVRFEIYDEAAKTITQWNTGPGTMAEATVNHLNTTPQPDWKDIPRTPSLPYRPEYTREDLGTRTIAGIEAKGYRMTEVIAVGREGNDAPLKIVHELWTNQQYHATLMAVDDDPRTGRNTWEVESVTTGAPDPAFFTPPANYRLWDPDAARHAQTSADTKP